MAAVWLPIRPLVSWLPMPVSTPFVSGWLAAAALVFLAAPIGAFGWNYAVNVSWTWRHAPE